MRKKLVGKDVCFVKETGATSNVERGTLYLGKDVTTGENVIDSLVSAGLVEVRRTNKGGLVLTNFKDFLFLNLFNSYLTLKRRRDSTCSLGRSS